MNKLERRTEEPEEREKEEEREEEERLVGRWQQKGKMEMQ